MPKYYDDDGNEVEVDINLADLPGVVEKAKTFEEQLKKNEKELEKLREKEVNFAHLRTKTKAEQEEFKAQMSAKERMFYEEIESLKNQITDRDNATIGKAKEERIKRLANGDEALEQKIRANFDRLGGNPLSPEQLDEQLEEAFALTEVQVSKTRNVNPINAYTPTSSGVSPWGQKKTNFADTDEGDSFAKSLGLSTGKK